MKKVALAVLALTLLAFLAFPTSAMAWTRWHLEGWRVDQSKWMGGLLWTYYEDDWVPYRLVATGYDGLDTDIAIQHDYLDADGDYGIDGARNFFVGPQTNRGTAPGTITPVYEAGVDYGGTTGVVFDVILPPSIVPVPNGSMIEYHFIVYNTDALTALGDFAFYWEAHCSLTGSTGVTFGETIAYGSSYWNGASLHAHTSVTGNQDVPIKTPSTSGAPSIDVEKYLGVCDVWYDSDVPPGPSLDASGIWPIYFKFVVTNTGTVTLTEIALTDSVYDLSSASIPSSLAPGDSFEVVIGPFVPALGQQCDIATATGVYGKRTFQDTDSEYYFGY